MLDADQLASFDARGVLRLDGSIGRAVVDGVADDVWSFLARRGADRHDPATWPTGRVGKLQALRKGDVYGPIVTDPAITAVADQLLGTGEWVHATEAQGLITFPEPGPWRLPHKIWHFDLPARGPAHRLTALRLIGIVEPVQPRGGATIVVEGAHELVHRLVEADPDEDAGRSADVRRRLAREHPWFRELAQDDGSDRERFFEPVEIDGVTVRVAELIGDAGDVWLMHPWTFHGLAPNTSDRIRSMCTHTLLHPDQRFFGAD